MLAVLLGAYVARATQPEAVRPQSAARIARVFDFEEPNNPLPVPAHWVRGQHDPLLPRIRPTFPAWNRAEFSNERAHSGQRSVLLPTQGGSTSLILRSGTVPVLPGADYRVSAWVCTDGLEHARAALAARFVDEDGNVLPQADVRSEPIRSEGKWTIVDVFLPGADAAFLQIELLLLQPVEFESHAVDFPELVTREDVDGRAWFDDVMVVQLPRTEMRTDTPGNVIPASQKPRVHVEVRDLTGEDLQVVVRALDVAGAEVDRVSFPFEGGRARFEWEPTLDKLGWYRCVVEISDGERVVGTDFLDFAWVLGPSDIVVGSADDANGTGLVGSGGGGSADRSRFALYTELRDPKRLAQIPDLSARVGVGMVVLPAWWDSTSNDPTEQINEMMPVIRAMRANWQEVSLAFDRMPSRVAADFGLDPTDVLGLFALSKEQYAPLLRPMLDRLGQVVRRWQVGGIFDELLVGVGGGAESIARIEAEVRVPVPEAELAVPWPIDVVPDTSLFSVPDRVRVLHANGPIGHTEAAELGELWSGDSSDPMSETPQQLVLTCEDPARFGYALSAEAFARTVIEAWAAVGPRHDSVDRHGGEIGVFEPWSWTSHREPRLMPRPEAAVLRNLIERLADRAGSVDLEVGPGVRCVLLEPRAGAPADRGAAIAVWAEADVNTPAYLDLMLAAGDVSVVDIYGNAHEVKRVLTGPLQIPSHHIPISSTPIFVEGVDAKLLRFLTSLKLEPEMLSSQADEQQHQLIMKNPWPTPIRGELYIVEPGGFSTPDGEIDRSWQISPRVIDFSLDAGEEKGYPLLIAFSPFEESGRRGFLFDIDITAEQEYGTLRIERPVEIGVPGLRMRVTYRLGPDPGGPNVYVDVDVFNVGAEAVTFRLMAQAPGFPRDSTSISDLAPGSNARRTFIFSHGVESLRGLNVFVSLSVPDQDTRLNDSVLIE